MRSFDSEGRGTRRGQSGFTVLELLVAATLTAIVLGISGPMLTKVSGSFKLDGFTRQLVMEISKARMQAIAQNRNVRVRFPTTTSYVVESSEDGTNYQPVGETISMPDGISVVYQGTPRFNRQGLAAESSIVWVMSPSGIQAFQMSLLGRIERSYI